METNTTEYDTSRIERKKNESLKIIDQYSKQLNTNISDYTIDDIFNLLDIELANMDNYETLKDEINEKIDNYVEMFSKLENETIVNFFENIRMTIIGKEIERKNLTEAEKLLELYNQENMDTQGENITTQNTKKVLNDFYDSSKGAGNPINRKTVTKVLTIDSRFRNNYNSSTSTNYNIDIPYTINNTIQLRLSDLEFPTTYYTFNDEYENNYFWIKINNNSIIYVYIKPGNYYHESLITTINTELDELDDNTFDKITINFNLDYATGGIGNGDGKITISNSGTNIGTNNIELKFNSVKLTPSYENYNKTHLVTDSDIEKLYDKTSNVPFKQLAGWMFGFRQPIYSSNQSSYTSEGILDILGPKYLYLVVDDLQKSSNINFFSNSEESLLNGNILARISMKGYAFSIQSQSDFRVYSEPRYYYGPVNIHKLNVKVIDEYGRILNLNNMDFSFTLSLDTIYAD
jgi:hypothetical protein